MEEASRARAAAKAKHEADARETAEREKQWNDAEARLKALPPAEFEALQAQMTEQLLNGSLKPHSTTSEFFKRSVKVAMIRHFLSRETNISPPAEPTVREV